MNVALKPGRTGLLAIAAAGIFAAGTVADRANRLYSPTVAPADARVLAHASTGPCDAEETEACQAAANSETLAAR